MFPSILIEITHFLILSWHFPSSSQLTISPILCLQIPLQSTFNILRSWVHLQNKAAVKPHHWLHHPDVTGRNNHKTSPWVIKSKLEFLGVKLLIFGWRFRWFLVHTKLLGIKSNRYFYDKVFTVLMLNKELHWIPSWFYVQFLV